MLGAVRVGKRKRKNNAATSENKSAADLLRQQLQMNLSSSSTSSSNKKPSTSSSVTPKDNTIVTGEFLSESVSKRMNVKNAHHESEVSEKDVSTPTLLLSTSTSTTAPSLQIEDMRRGSRKGKIKVNPNEDRAPPTFSSYQLSSTSSSSFKEQQQFQQQQQPTKDDNNISNRNITDDIQQMIQEENQSKMSMDEIYARNIKRLGSKFKNNDFSQSNDKGASAGADEEDYHGDGGANTGLFSETKNLTEKAQLEREKSRQIAQYQTQTAITNKCWWWMESASFPKHLLLSLGDHVSLVLVPPHIALVPGHVYLVPVKHAESFVNCEDDVWDEIQRFRNSIRKMYHTKDNSSVLFCETVLPSKGLWQARMDVIPVPNHVEQDAPLHFRSALNEQAEEWGTHTKLLSTHKSGGLRRTIPKSFPYVNIEWNDGGYAQIIESERFPKDFLLDTIGSMMHLDPLRFRRKKQYQDKKKKHEEERQAVLDFCQKFKEFDWTVDLD